MKKEKYGYAGVFAYKQLNPASLGHYSAEVATPEYLAHLASLGQITETIAAECCGILFKEPAYPSGDRVGKTAVVKMGFPCKETAEAVKIKQAAINSESHPLFYHYTLALFPILHLGGFDNRVFSLDDYKIERYHSCPPGAQVAFLGNEKITHYHVMYRVAYRGQSTLLDEETVDDMAEIIRKSQADLKNQNW